MTARIVLGDVHMDGVVELSVGGLTFPISRDELVKLLFGGESLPKKSQQRKGPGVKKAKPRISGTKMRFEERRRKGTCSYCDGKRVEGKLLCAKHLKGARLRAIGARAHKAKLSKQRLNGKHLNGSATT